MNPLLARLHPYPFERLKELSAGIVPASGLKPIGLGIGEPRHATPALIEDALVKALPGLSSYPATAGEPALREAFAGWLQRRYGVTVDPLAQTLPINGSREALFALAQTVIDPTRPGATVVCPNPFYQIYEGAALLAGAQTAFANSDRPATSLPTGRRSTTPPGRGPSCSTSAPPATRPARSCRSTSGRACSS
jgi:N-succinyldiaminopimelate aminotransferase